jgi:hypothetical protein
MLQFCLSLSGLIDCNLNGATALGGRGSLGLTGRIGDAPAALDLKGRVKQSLQGSAPPNEFNALLTLTVGF